MIATAVAFAHVWALPMAATVLLLVAGRQFLLAWQDDRTRSIRAIQHALEVADGE